MISTEGRNFPKSPRKKKGKKSSDGKTKRHKTKPTNKKERIKKTKRSQKSGAEPPDAKRGGSDDVWVPDPNDLDETEWEKALISFFTKHNKDKLPSVPKMARMYSRKRGKYMHGTRGTVVTHSSSPPPPPRPI